VPLRQNVGAGRDDDSAVRMGAIQALDHDDRFRPLTAWGDDVFDGARRR
jgi:hypothetical protein